jgi:hypothetical protein
MAALRFTSYFQFSASAFRLTSCNQSDRDSETHPEYFTSGSRTARIAATGTAGAGTGTATGAGVGAARRSGSQERPQDLAFDLDLLPTQVM